MNKMIRALACFLLVTPVVYSAESDVNSRTSSQLCRVSKSERKEPFLTVLDGCKRSCTILPSEDGSKAVSGSDDGRIRVWDMYTGQLLNVLCGHEDRVRCVVISADARTVVSGSSDKTVKVWDVDREQLLHTLRGHKDAVTKVAFSAVEAIAVSRSCDKTVRIWDTVAGTILRILKTCSESLLWPLSLSADGKTFAFGSNDKEVKVCSTNTGKLLHLLHHKEKVDSVALSEDGKKAISGSCDGSIRLWDTDAQKKIASMHPYKNDPLSVTNVGLCNGVLLMLRDGIALVCDVETGEKIRSVRCTGKPRALSADGKTLVLFDVSCEAVKIWHLPSIKWAKRAMTLPQYGLIKAIQEFGKFCKEREQPLSLSVFAWRLLGLDNTASVEDKDAATTSVAALFNSIPDEPRKYLVKKNNIIPHCLSAEEGSRKLCNLLYNLDGYKPRTWSEGVELHEGNAWSEARLDQGESKKNV